MTARDYTMDDFRAEMRRRGIHAEPSARPGRTTAPPSAPAKKRAQPHGNTITKIAACPVHPLHLVKIRPSGARTGCPMCEMQIEDLCRALSSKPPPDAPRSLPAREHWPRVAADRATIVGCSCGWRVPAGTVDPDNALVEHATVHR
jgi:hypothetical protein